MSKFKRALLIVLVIVAVIFVTSLFPGDVYQGIIPDPVQVDLIRPETITITDSYNEAIDLSLMAEYTIEGIVKSIAHYSDDYPSRIAEYDFALAWGELNKKEIDEEIKYSQSGRWYRYSCSEECIISQNYISTHSSNVHLIHEDAYELYRIGKIKRDDHVRLTGYLVNVNFEDGPWNTSLTREDTGNGACEIMYVTDVEVIE